MQLGLQFRTFSAQPLSLKPFWVTGQFPGTLAAAGASSFLQASCLLQFLALQSFASGSLHLSLVPCLLSTSTVPTFLLLGSLLLSELFRCPLAAASGCACSWRPREFSAHWCSRLIPLEVHRRQATKPVRKAILRLYLRLRHQL